MNSAVVESIGLIFTTWGPLMSAKILAHGRFRFLPLSWKSSHRGGIEPMFLGSAAQLLNQWANQATTAGWQGGLSPLKITSTGVYLRYWVKGGKTNYNSSPNAVVYKTRLGCRQTRAACLQVWLFGKKKLIPRACRLKGRFYTYMLEHAVSAVPVIHLRDVLFFF